MSWKRFARDLHDGHIEQICILSDVERMESEAEELKQLVTEGADDLSVKSKKERSDDAPTFCVKKAQGGWRIVHAYNKLNDATVPAQTPIPRKAVIIDSMVLSTIVSALDLRDGFYLILMRESDIPFTASDVEMHKEHLRQLFALMGKPKLYANLKKCIFGASEIPVLGCLVGKNGVRPDPGKVRVINEWPSTVKELRQFRGPATYSCKYGSNYAGKIHPLLQLRKNDAAWDWTTECQHAFNAVKQALTEAPILAVADQDRPFHVVCDTFDFAIG
ncbi:unnamed protein product [Phytophthora fragariaefolia]|uniref:Unnamed protein product n=1 Tax=Phytophthora fragariaefolia TaxID=1490495 RepID=A0A9W6XIR6_9STRA|nr:unnamed protein product [Phytophthora fragariaefolia]